MLMVEAVDGVEGGVDVGVERQWYLRYCHHLAADWTAAFIVFRGSSVAAVRVRECKWQKMELPTG